MKRMELWAIVLLAISMFVEDDLIAIGFIVVASTLFGILIYRWLAGITQRTAP